MKIKFFATYRAITNCKELTLTASGNILSLLEELSQRYPGLRDAVLSPDGTDLGENSVLLLNGRNICHLGGVHTVPIDTDIVAIFPLVAGG